MQPLLRWAGSKKRQFAAYQRFFPAKFERYLEPFAGSAAFAFRLNRTEALLNDINADLINFYEVCAARAEDLYTSFIALPRTSEAYYQARSEYHSCGSRFERAVLFYYLNRNCFNGIFRVNKLGRFNVPFSNRRVSPYLSREQFLASANFIANSKVQCMDFELFCSSHSATGDFVFIDPPYYNDTQRIFNEYNSFSFNKDDFARLCAVLDQLEHNSVKFLLSFPDSEKLDPIKKKWNFNRTSVRRTVSANSAGRKVHFEALISNY